MNEVVEKIANKIRRAGPIPFAAFMELALYCPVYGYYETEKDSRAFSRIAQPAAPLWTERAGRDGDYYTSVSVGSLFGELLAFQIAEWLEEIVPRSKARSARAETPQIVEAGAHDGRLAVDILTWMREHRPQLLSRLRYRIVEPSPRRQAWQKARLRPFADRVRWIKHLAAPRHGGSHITHEPRRLSGHASRMTGIIFSNELLDAMPVHRLGWDAKKQDWFEWAVTLRRGRFAWTRIAPTLPLSNPRFQISNFPLALGKVLPDGFTTEICPAAEQWWSAAAESLVSGKLLTIDYGLSAEEFFVPERREGTLRAYRSHQPIRDVLANPGEQDLTSHVNFTALQAAGESAGLTTEGFLTQEQFLTGIAERTWENQAPSIQWTHQRRRQFQTLTHPQLMGRAFRVLVQARAAIRR